MKRPIIGVNCNFKPHEGEEGNFNLEKSYTQAVYESGGMPQIIPTLPLKEIPNLLDMYDGILLTGGGGLLPHVKEMDELPGLYEQNPKRHQFDRELARQAMERRMPVLGICRGHQTINELREGTIKNLNNNHHRQREPGNTAIHKISVVPDTLLYGCVKAEEIRVNSFHSQVIDTPGKDLKVSSYSADGHIESIEGTEDSFIMGVQFHPEFMRGSLAMTNIYSAFARAAKLFRENEKI